MLDPFRFTDSSESSNPRESKEVRLTRWELRPKWGNKQLVCRSEVVDKFEKKTISLQRMR